MCNRKSMEIISEIFITTCTHVHHSLRTEILVVEGFGLTKYWLTTPPPNPMNLAMEIQSFSIHYYIQADRVKNTKAQGGNHEHHRSHQHLRKPHPSTLQVQQTAWHDANRWPAQPCCMKGLDGEWLTGDLSRPPITNLATELHIAYM